MCLYVCVHFFTCYRNSLFGGSSIKMIDADLSRLYTATSLMQIDDNIMRYMERRIYARVTVLGDTFLF